MKTRILFLVLSCLGWLPLHAATTGKIVYYSNIPDNGTSLHYQISIINGDGTGNTRLNRTTDDLYPALSPDGSKIAFVTNNGNALFLMNPDGTGAAAIPNTQGCSIPSWSGDGTKLAAVCSLPSGKFLCTVNVDGSNFRTVTSADLPGPLVAFDPTLSPDGSKIAFAAYTFEAGRATSYRIYVVKADGASSPVKLSTDDTVNYRSPAWSPDGAAIAVNKGSSPTTGNGGIFKLDAANGAETRITPNVAAYIDSTPSYSPDGTQIAYQDNGGSTGLAVMNVDGSNRRAYTTPRANSPKWSRAAPATAQPILNPANGHYYQFVSASVNWRQAQAAAMAQQFMGASGYLATITEASEQEFIRSHFGTNFPGSFSVSPVWLGALQAPGSIEPAGGFAWGTGEAFSYTNWGAGEPNNNTVAGNENVIEIRNDGFWNDTAETRPGIGYMAEFSAGGPTPTPTAPPHGGLSATTFTVNESSNSPTSNVADTVLRFRAVQTGTPAKVLVRVQANSGSGWADLPDGLAGRMTYAPQVTGYILNSTNYPTVNGISFRAVSSAPGYPDSISNVVGPFNLASSTPHLGPTKLFVTTNGEINAIRFGVNEATVPAGVSVRVQATQTPAVETSWTDAPIGSAGGMTQDTSDARQWYLGTDDYPAGEGVYFRAVASAPGNVDSLSISYGPFKFVSDPASTVTISVNGANNAPNDIDGGYLLPSGSFNIAATASSGRFLKRLTLLYDGNTVAHFDNGATAGAIDYTSNIPGDHLIEAYATDDLGVTGAAAPIHVRILPAAPGKAFMMTASGDWNNAANWIDIQGNPGVPGPRDFAIVSTFNPTITGSVTVNAMSLNGGTLNGTGTLTVTAFATIADGTIKANLTIPSGSTLECLNDKNITLTGRLTYAGTLRLHGKGGIDGMRTAATSSASRAGGPQPDGLFDFVGGFINGVGKFIADLAGGGRRGSKATPAARPLIAPEKRIIAAAKINILAGTVTAIPAPARLISQDGGGLIGQDGGGLITQDGGGLVASGGGNLVASGGGNLVASGGGNLLSQDGGGLVASGGGNLVATGGGNLVASGGGNLVASGGGNAPVFVEGGHSLDVAAAGTGVTLSGGEVDMSEFTIFGDTVVDGGVLSGSGVLLGNLSNNSGFISPGHSAGALAVTGAYSQGSAGGLIVEVGGSAPSQFDQLLVGGAASLNGSLILRTSNGYAPDAADTFNPISFETVAGSFSTVSAKGSVMAGANGLLTSLNPAIGNPIPPALRNISTRALVETGDNVLIGGFIVSGPGPKKVLIRAIGPSLPVPGALADTVLELHEGDGTVMANDNWRSNQEQEIIASTVPPTSDLESAIVATLQPGAHTAIVRGKGGATGVALVEVYDLEPSATATLANISTRGRVHAGDEVMIGGFIVQGVEPARVLVRVVGPSLAAAGVAGALADPTLDLVDRNGNTVATNDDWRATQEAQIISTTVPPTDAREAAIVAYLVPGAYTAIVRGKDGTTGVALVEVYDLR